MGLLDKNVWRQNSPGNRGYFVTVANIFGHILKIKIICQNPNKNRLPLKYVLIKNIIIGQLIE